MKGILRSGSTIACCALIAAALVVPWSSAAQQRGEAQLLVLIAAASGITNIESGTLHRVFDAYPAIVGGMRLIPLNQTVGAPARVAFDRKVLKVEPEAVGRYWTDRRIRELLKPPRTIPTVELLLRVLVSLPGTISYALMDPAAVPHGLRALTIDGKKPSDRDYPLR